MDGRALYAPDRPAVDRALVDGFRACWRAPVAGLCWRDDRGGAQRVDGGDPGGGKARSARRPGDGARSAQALRRAAAFGALSAGRSRWWGQVSECEPPSARSRTDPWVWAVFQALPMVAISIAA